jgi:hypothetical protein
LEKIMIEYNKQKQWLLKTLLRDESGTSRATTTFNTWSL